MRPPQERAANENRMEPRDPRRNPGRGSRGVRGKVIIIWAEAEQAEGLLSISSARPGAWGGEAQPGLSGGLGGSHFPRWSQGQGGAATGSQGPGEALRGCSLRPQLRNPLFPSPAWLPRWEAWDASLHPRRSLDRCRRPEREAQRSRGKKWETQRDAKEVEVFSFLDGSPLKMYEGWQRGLRGHEDSSSRCWALGVHQ